MLLTTACQTYTPVPAQGVAPGGRVRVRLTERGSADITPSVGPSARTIDGTVTSISDSAVVLSVTDLTRYNGQEEPWRGESVTVPRAGVADITVPKLSRSRSLLFAGGIILGAVAIGSALGGTGTDIGKSGPGGPGGSQ